MPRTKAGQTPRVEAYGEPVDPSKPDGPWKCKTCGKQLANRGAVQLHQRTHQGHQHTWRLLRDRGEEARAIADGWTQVCTGCGDLQ